MNRRLTAGVGALQALTTMAIGLGVLVVPLLILWLVEQNGMTNVLVSYRSAVDLWLLAQGVPIDVAAGKFAGLAFTGFTISLLPLSYSAFLAWMAFRLGRKLSGAPELWSAWLGAAAVYELASYLLSLTVQFAGAEPNSGVALVMPVVFFMAFVVIGSVVGEPRAVYGVGKNQQAVERVAIRNFFSERFERLPWFVRVSWSPAWRAGTAITIATFAVSALAIGLLVMVNWISVITFYESLHVSVLGGFLLTVGQIALLPNIVVWGASWFTGAGFAIGAGSLISPLGSAAGPLPMVPILSVLPQGTLGFGMIAVAVPLVLGFLATVWVRDHARDVRYEFATPLASALSLGLSIAFVTATELALVGWLASGGFGPDRFQTAGINPLMLFIVSFAEVAAVSVLTSFYSAKPDKADHPLLRR
ncbi:MAG: DUF6350 family protein [Micrococcales bacterium]